MKYTIRDSASADTSVRRDKRVDTVVLLRRLTALLAVLAAVFSVYSFRGDITDAYLSLKARITREDTEETVYGRIDFEPDDSNLFALCGSNLAVLNKSSLKCYSPSGEELISLVVSFSRPALCVSDKYMAVYDRGGTSVTVTDGEKITKDITLSGAVISVEQNSKGTLAVTHGDDTYRAAVDVFDENLKPVYRWNTSEYYLLGAAVSPSGKMLAVTALTQESGVLKSKIVIYEMTSEEVYATYDFEEDVAVDTEFLSDTRLCVVGEKKTALIDVRGAEVYAYAYGDDALKTCAVSDGFAVLSLSNRVSGLGSRLVSVNGDGEMFSLEIEDEVRGLSVNNGFAAVLYTQSMEILSVKLERYGEPVEVFQPRKLLVTAEGMALPIYSADANFVDFITPFQAAANG